MLKPNTLLCIVLSLLALALQAAPLPPPPLTEQDLAIPKDISFKIKKDPVTEQINLNGKNVALTEQQTVALFYQRNLSLIAAHFNIDVSQAQEVIAAAIPNPIFSFAFGELNPNMVHNSNSNAQMPAVAVGLSQLIETAGKRRLRIEGSALATEAVTFDLQDTLRTLTNAVRRDYYALLLAQKSLQMTQDNFKRYQEILRVNRIRLKTGDISDTDYTRIEVESLKAQADQDLAQSNLKQSRAALLLLLGWPEDSLNIVAVDAWPKAVSNITASKQDQLVTKAIEQRPDLQAARIRISQAQKLLSLAKSQVIPDITLSAYYLHDVGNYFVDTGSVGVSLPLPLFYRQEGEISTARININSSELALRQIEQSIRSDVMKFLAAWQSADAIAQRFETLVVTRIETLRKEQEFAYENGAIGLLDLIDAERSYKAMMLDYYTALANRSNAWADLLMAYGEEIK